MAQGFTRTVSGIPIPESQGGTGVSEIQSCSVYNSTATDCGPLGFTKVALQTENFDNGGIFDNTTNYRCTPTKAGIYLVCWQIGISDTDVSVSTQNNSVLYKNGSAYRYGNYNYNLTNLVTSLGSSLVTMNGSTDYLELYMFVGQNNTLSTNNSNLVTYMDVTWIGPN